jgi:hypothetical protein
MAGYKYLWWTCLGSRKACRYANPTMNFGMPDVMILLTMGFRLIVCLLMRLLWHELRAVMEKGLCYLLCCYSVFYIRTIHPLFAILALIKHLA